MREIRLSGSVEGVVSNHDPYSDFPEPLVVKQPQSAWVQGASIVMKSFDQPVSRVHFSANGVYRAIAADLGII
jgi:hypothetical protein